jgi:Fungal cellulose binding domain
MQWAGPGAATRQHHQRPRVHEKSHSAASITALHSVASACIRRELRRRPPCPSHRCRHAGLHCQLNCCPVGQACCGAFCEAPDAAGLAACADVPGGCCSNLANECAKLPSAQAAAGQPSEGAPAPGASGTPGTVASDGSSSRASSTTGSDSAGAVPPGGPCTADCCLVGTFCCGDACRPVELQSALTCPAAPSCCANSQLLCSTGAETPVLVPAPTPVPGPTPAPAPEPIQVEAGPVSIAPGAPVATPSMFAPEAAVAPAVGPGVAPGVAPEVAPGMAPFPDSQLCADGCEPWWGDCGGRDYYGPGCCTAGSSCVSKNPSFGRCVPDVSSPLCSPGPPEKAGLFCQCGGANFIGPLECGEGLMCVKANAFYSQCRPQCSTGDSRRRR